MRGAHFHIKPVLIFQYLIPPHHCKAHPDEKGIETKDRKMPFKQTVSLQEFDKGMANWKTMPGTMIRKVALVQALRECFAIDLAGCYDSAEIDQAIEAEYEVGT